MMLTKVKPEPGLKLLKEKLPPVAFSAFSANYMNSTKQWSQTTDKCNHHNLHRNIKHSTSVFLVCTHQLNKRNIIKNLSVNTFPHFVSTTGLMQGRVTATFH